jgi:hypothetical protein
MTAPSSQTVRFALCQQAAKGTEAAGSSSYPFIAGIGDQSQMQPAFDWIEPKNQHAGLTLRPTARQSRRIAANYLENVKLKCRLYPDLAGLLLIGSGFADAPAAVAAASEVWTLSITGTPAGGSFALRFFASGTPASGWQTTATIPYNPTNSQIQTALGGLANIGTGNVAVTGTAPGPFTVTFQGTMANMAGGTLQLAANSLTGGSAPGVALTCTTPGSAAYYDHVFTLADRAAISWLSMLWRTADPTAGSTATFERAATDVRFTKTMLTADAAGMVLDLTGYGISEAPSLGTETVTAETNQPFSPYSGSFSALWDGGQLEGLALSHKLTFDQGLYKDEKKLHTWGRADFPPNGTDISGDLTGVDMVASVYRSINWGSLYGSAPSALIPEAALDFNWTTEANMPGCSVPYKLRVQVPTAQVYLGGNVEANGANLIRLDSRWEMLDMGGEATPPITITLTNLRAAYTGT